jgi:Ca2+-binding RTX toxin-like protein
MTTTSNSTTTGITLSSPPDVNPIVVDSGVTISNSGNAVYGAGGFWTILNAGTIEGTTGSSGYGIDLLAGGSVTNAASAAIDGYTGGIVIENSAGTIVNSGSIAGTGTASYGIHLLAGGSVTDATSASISGGTGVYIANGAGTVINSGSLVGANYYGVVLNAGGSVTNASSASITGLNMGVLIENGAGTVVNSGSIAGSESYGVKLHAGGTVINAASASIVGAFAGVTVQTSVGTVVNSGRIAGNDGVAIGPGGSVTNAAAATIAGYGNGIYFRGGGAVVNSGSIVGAGFDGVFMFSGGAVTNAASGSIAGKIGIYLYSGGSTVTNAGTIAGRSGAAVVFHGTASNRLVVDPGAVFSGQVSGSTSASNTLELAAGGSATLSGLGTNFVNFNSVTVDSGATWELTGANTFAAGATLVNDGTLINSGALIFDTTASTSSSVTLEGSGIVEVSGGGTLDLASSGAGSAQIDGSSTLEFTSTFAGTVAFSGASTGAGGTLKFDAGSTGQITVVNSNDTVIAQPGSNNWINSAVDYTLPANIDALFLYAGSHGAGNSDAAGDGLYALDTTNAQTLTGNSANDTFVVYNSSDVLVPKGGSHDAVYAATSYTLPTGIDALILEGSATLGVGNSDAAGDGLYAANPNQAATLTGNSANDTFVVYNSSDVVVPKAGSHDVVYSAVNYTLPTGVDILVLEGSATQGVGNSDAAGDALYAANPNQVATLTGNSANDTFVVYNSADVVVPNAGSHDIVYTAVDYTLPTGVDSLILEAGTQAVGNSDAGGDTLYAADAGIAQTVTGNSRNDTFVVYNSADTVIGQAGSTDNVYAAANFTLPTNVDTLFLEGSSATQGTGNGDPADALYGNAGVASTLVAGSGADLLVVTGIAGTILTGGAGHDTFAFPNVMGLDEVTNFDVTKDTLQFNATLFSNFTAAMNAASQVGANTVFTIDANDTVTVDNVTKTSLTAGNFHFT